MHLTAFVSVAFAFLGMSAATPVAKNHVVEASNLDARACDCPGVRACCEFCMRHSPDGVKCCNTTCMTTFPGCEGAC